MDEQERQMDEQEKQEEEEETLEEEASSESPDTDEPPPPRPSFLASLEPKATAASERTGAAAHRLVIGTGSRMRPVLEGVGARLEEPTRQPDELSDLFERPNIHDNDMETADLVELDEEDVFGDGGADMSDILEVDEEDIMGEEDYIDEEEWQPKRRHTSSIKRRQPPSPPSAGVSGVLGV